MKKNIFFKLLFISFIIFLSLYIAEESGYYEATNEKNSYITEENIKQFESDIKEGKDIDITNYVETTSHDYSSPVSKIGQSLETKIDNFVEYGLGNFFNTISKLFY